MYNILIIEDEEKLRNELSTFLNNNGYKTIVLTEFNNVEETILKSDADLVLLDINLPNINGEFVLKNIRKSSNIPVIIVTSRNTEVDELISINYGADDFITKPYNSEILLARLENILKRRNTNDALITYKDIKIDASSNTILKDDKIIDLSRNEFKIFFYLIKNRGKIIERDELIDYLWENDEFIDDNTLTVNINRLRNKLEDIGLENTIITKRGQGYLVL